MTDTFLVQRCRATWPKQLPCKIAVVGEAPGKNEILFGQPFIGRSGEEFTRMLAEAEIERSELLITNVLMIRPPDNQIKSFCLPKREAAKAMPEGQPYPIAPVGSGAYIRPDILLPELERLKDELIRAKPNIVIALGGTALAALCNLSGITKNRGVVHESTLIPGLKVLPTFHPAAILREWKYRVIAVADLCKAKAESEFATIRRGRRTIWMMPELADLWTFKQNYLDGGRCVKLSFDIECQHRVITCIGFAPSATVALVVPFVDRSRPGYAYWPTATEEKLAWKFVREVLESPIPKITQNGLFDIQWLLRYLIKPQNVADDTMILHHALYPEIKKDLGFMGSLYAEGMTAWKVAKPRGKKPWKLED